MAYNYTITGKKDRAKAKGLSLPKPKASPAKIQKVMGEFQAGTLTSGSANGPKVTNPKQALAIALNSRP